MAGMVETESLVAARTLRGDGMAEMSQAEDAGQIPERLQGTIDALLVLMPVLTRRIAAMAIECPLGHKPSLPQVRVMTVVSAQGKATISSIADALQLSRPAISEMIDRMVEIGYVAREVNPADRRQVLISLTPPAARTMDGIVAQRRAVLLESLGDLSDDELAGFLKGMRGFTRTIAPEVMEDPILAPVCGQTDTGVTPR